MRQDESTSVGQYTEVWVLERRLQSDVSGVIYAALALHPTPKELLKAVSFSQAILRKDLVQVGHAESNKQNQVKIL